MNKISNSKNNRQHKIKLRHKHQLQNQTIMKAT